MAASSLTIEHMFDYYGHKMTPPVLTRPEPETQARSPAALRRECLAFVAVVRYARDRGVVGISLMGGGDVPSGEQFIPFSLREKPSLRGRDFAYAGLAAALDRLSQHDVRRLIVHVDDPLLAAELARRADPPPELTMLYISVGCKLNQFAGAKIVFVPRERLAALREKCDAVASALKRRRDAA